MILWIEAQDTAVIALLTFALCYAIALVILAACALLARHPSSGELKVLTPVLLTPLSIIVGLLIAFLAARVWTNLDRANGYVASEAGAVREAGLLAASLPPSVRDAVHQDLRQYAHFVETADWPAMLADNAHAADNPSARETPSQLIAALSALLSFNAAESGQRVAQDRAVAAMERVLEARRGRILLSGGVIAPVQWLVIFVLDALILLTVGIVHIDRLRVAATGMFLYSTAVACCLVLLLIHDRPFAAGGLEIPPDAVLQAVLD